MRRLLPKLYIPALLAFFFASSGALALDCTVVDVFDSGAARKVTANTALIDFGIVTKDESSLPVVLSLTNDEAVSITVLALTFSDSAITLFNPAVLEPTTLQPGETLDVSLQYNNTTSDSEITGKVTVHTLGGGSESTVIDFVVNSGAPGDQERSNLGKPNEGWYLGPCFLDTLLAR